MVTWKVVTPRKPMSTEAKSADLSLIHFLENKS